MKGMLRTLVLLSAIALAMLASAAVIADPTPAPDALTVLRKAEAAARANPDPPFIVYDMHEIFIHHGRQFTYDYHVWYRTDGHALMQNVLTDRNGHHEQHFGYPFPFAPDINILLYATPAPTAAPLVVATPTPAPSGHTSPPLISIQAITASRYYTVSLIGLEDYQGHSVYHLGLTPLPGIDQKAHPWRDLWVDAQTYEVWKAHALGCCSIGLATGTIEGTAEFEPVGPYWLLAHASGYGQGHIAFISDSGQYEYFFSGFDFPETLPDWYFDPDLFRHH